MLKPKKGDWIYLKPNLPGRMRGDYPPGPAKVCAITENEIQFRYPDYKYLGGGHFHWAFDDEVESIVPYMNIWRKLSGCEI